MVLVALYLSAIVAANLILAFVQANAPDLLTVVTLMNAGVFIAFDLTTRDALHERWRKHLWRNMALLIGTGAALSALLNIYALPIAIASFTAFAAAGIADTLVYQALGKRAWWVKVNGSNMVSAAVDSLLFPVLAFVVLQQVMTFEAALGIAAWQFIVKVIGGAFWSLALHKRRAR